MADRVNATADCRMVGEYVDEGEVPAGLVVRQGEPVRPSVVATYVDTGVASYPPKEFTVLVRDGVRDDIRTIKVRGYRLRQVAPTAAGASGWLGVLAEPGEQEVYAALFPGDKVVAAFCGDAQPLTS